MIEGLENEPRLVIDAQLEPMAGSIFQPTGFPDLGAATFQRPGGERTSTNILVESVQSMTNRLEEIGWDAVTNTPVETIASLPYVRVESANGVFLTSSRLEPHRLAAAYVRDADFEGRSGGDLVTEKLGLDPGRPLDWPRIYRSIFELDPLCLLHGVFFSAKEWHGNPKVRRAITAVIEAHDAEPVISGGLKRDDVRITKSDGGGAEEGYGFVPFGRTEYTAAEIVLSAVIDLHQIHGYGLADDETALLVALALWEVTKLLEDPLRLRTACDLQVTAVNARRPSGFQLPAAEAIERELESIAGRLGGGAPLLGVWTAPKAKAAAGTRS